ncbi:MAG: HIRAN protein [Betaproteobacteria bacterium]|nr:HIRAN protein [Betaproteobacteria bacterium]
MRTLVLWALALWTCQGAAETPTFTARILLQHTLAAGLRHHDAKMVWDYLRVGDEVLLVREADNPHDPNAVRLVWQEWILGYLPRRENRFVARQLDRGAALQARITALGKHRNHRRRLEVEIYAPVSAAPRPVSD